MSRECHAVSCACAMLHLPQDVILRIQVASGDPVAICGVEQCASGVACPSELQWADALAETYPTLRARLGAEGFDGSFKQVFARRAHRADEWRLRKELHSRGRSDSSQQEKPKTKKKKHEKLFFADNRQGHLADSTLRLKICGRCGEKFQASSCKVEDSCRRIVVCNSTA
eukprot:TRINITY_DN46014_c0_g1_i2.p1 TRINITY_DN46014_c0_g1~~TRINITY_DN46014_c0_g1_i2.p1  ORF type:complete len:170 (-),score=24.66 TRINITY_DN46014_c0_g1_i2:56-565(-)